jgi:hypothetical protein
VAPTINNGVGLWVGFAFDADGDTTFFTSTDSPWTPSNLINWVTLDTAATTATALNDAAQVLEVGTRETGTADELAGRVMRVIGINSTDKTAALVVDMDPRGFVSGTTFTAPTGEVWTLNGNAAIEGGLFPEAPFKAYGKEEPWGYLPEAAGTNLCLQSNDFDTTWANINSTETANYAVAPDGTKTAWRFIDDSGTGSGAVRILQSLTGLTTSGSKTISCHMKADQLTWGYMSFTSYGTKTITGYFDLTNGLVGTLGGDVDNAYMEYLGDGWYRCGLGFTADGS